MIFGQFQSNPLLMTKKQQQQKVSSSIARNLFSSNGNQTIQKPQQPIKNTAYLYTPTQYLISNFLTTKKTIEDNLISTLKSITEIRNNQQLNSSELKQQLKSKRNQLEGIKRKLNKSCEQQAKVYDIMKKRIHRHQQTKKRQYVGTDKKQQNTDPIISPQVSLFSLKQPIITIQQPQKDAIFHPDRLFDLQMNKEIVYFMVEQGVKKEKKLNEQQIMKEEIKKIQLMKEKQKQKQQKQKQQQKVKDSKNQQQRVENVENVNQEHQEEERFNLIYNNLPFIFIEEIQSASYDNENQGIEINMAEDIFDLERFFNVQQNQEGNSNINPIDKFHRKLKANQKGAKDKFLKNKNKKKFSQITELQYSRKDLFKEDQFVRAMENEGNQWKAFQKQKEKDNQIELQQNNLQNQPNQLKDHVQSNNKAFSSFKGQLQLQCMLYRKQHQISLDILNYNLQPVSLFLYENSHMVNKNRSHLEFWLTLCRAVELIKTKIQQKQMQGLEIIRSMIGKLKSQLENWQKLQLQKVTCMLLQSQQKIDIKPYLQKTQQAFRTVFQQIYKLPDFTRFLHTIYTGALILKTPTCIEKDKQNPLICPLCNPLAEKVFTNIPLLTRNQSSLICRINGSVMDHQNYPVMLPSYQIYSYKGLQDTKKVTKSSGSKTTEEYYCKFTETWYNKELAKKVYLA